MHGRACALTRAGTSLYSSYFACLTQTVWVAILKRKYDFTCLSAFIEKAKLYFLGTHSQNQLLFLVVFYTDYDPHIK